MIRAQRRPGIDEPVVITPAIALDYELTGAWPDRVEYYRFWNGARVPAHLRESVTPDPRAVLSDDLDRSLFERKLASWNAERLTWLEKEAARG